MNFRRSAPLIPTLLIAILAPALSNCIGPATATPLATPISKVIAAPPDCFDKNATADKVTFTRYQHMLGRDVEFDVPKQDGGSLSIGLLQIPEGQPDIKTTHQVAKTPLGTPFPEGNDFLTWVVNPIIVNADGTPQSRFNPPIRLVVTYDPNDADTSKANGHGGRLTLVAGYLKNQQWTYKILDASQDEKTLTACLSSLDPNDPLGVGHP